MPFFSKATLAAWLTLLLPMTLPAAQPMAADTVVPTSSVYFHKFFTGKIADKYTFTMDLKNLNGALTGTYRYTGKPADIYLQGNIESSGSFKMDELYGSKRTGVFTGVATGKKLVGVWQSSDGVKRWPFVADQTSEIVIGSKREILTKAMGDYALESISGSGGANGMWDTWKTKGKWQSNVSGISGGERQGNLIQLTRTDIRLLDSMTIKVDTDLTTRFLAGGKTVLVIPYRDGGMQVGVKSEHMNVEDELKQFSSDTTVLDERLYLLVQDGVDYANVIAGNFEATVSDIVIVSYSVVAGTFEVRFVTGECCGDSTFTFARRRRS